MNGELEKVNQQQQAASAEERSIFKSISQREGRHTAEKDRKSSFPRGECLNCRQKVPDAHFQAEMEKFESSLRAIEREIQDLKIEHKKKTKALEQLGDEAKSFKERIRSLEKELDKGKGDVKVKRSELDSLRKSIKMTKEAEESRKGQQAEVDEAKNELTSAEKSTADAEANLEDVNRLLAEARANVDRLAKRDKQLFEAKNTFNTQSSVRLQGFVQKWLAAFFGNPENTIGSGATPHRPVLQIKFSGDMKYTLSWDSDEQPFPVSTLSTGEYTRFHLAMFLGFSEFVSNSGQFDCNLLMLDECFLGIDSFGTIDILACLKSHATESRKSLFVSSISPFDHINIRIDRIIFLNSDGEKTQLVCSRAKNLTMVT